MVTKELIKKEEQAPALPRHLLDTAPIKKEVTWSETLAKINRLPFQEATKKMGKDGHELESLLDDVQRLMGDELETSFQSMGVVICFA